MPIVECTSMEGPGSRGDGTGRAIAALNTAPVRRASPAILLVALSLAGCASSSARIADATPVLASAEKASIARSLADVPYGATAPWTEIRTDAVGTARIVGEASGGCLPVEVMRLRDERFDTLHLDLCSAPAAPNGPGR